ncbi:ABC transporter ATP-binding protein [Tyzzerella sp. OttesenSCG-928-J15]|nr:ABC transporter ATP-binding protein [Tyzzerella sp. OttesenSCG-928-J15]
MVEIRNLYKDYGKFRAVNDLNLSIPEGSIFGLVGPNGAGKTTTMSIMSGLLTATAGSIFINGIDVIKDTGALKDKIGFMPDFFGVYDNLHVSEYMDFFEGAYGIPYAERKELTDNLLEIVDLSGKLDEYVDTLSRGMKQRLCLARCLIHDPDVLILDEPASGLDPRARIELKEILKQLKGMGKTIIISSHILSELAEMCSEVGIINHGQVVASGNVNDIMRRLRRKRTIYIKPLEMGEKLVKLLEQTPGITDIIENASDIEFQFDGENEEMSALIKQIVSSDIDLLGFREKEGNLEELFMELTGDEPMNEGVNHVKPGI